MFNVHECMHIFRGMNNTLLIVDLQVGRGDRSFYFPFMLCALLKCHKTYLVKEHLDFS
jgi:hypothetical protein